MVAGLCVDFMCRRNRQYTESKHRFNERPVYGKRDTTCRISLPFAKHLLPGLSAIEPGQEREDAGGCL